MHRVVIIGSGFAGLWAVKALRQAERRNLSPHAGAQDRRAARSVTTTIGDALELRGREVTIDTLGRTTPLADDINGDIVAARVRRTGWPARMEGCDSAEGERAGPARVNGRRSTISAPLKFAALLDTAIANADSRDQLAASPARLVAAADDARRRLVRDLHDGAQQRLVHAIITLKLAQQAARDHHGELDELLTKAIQHAEQANQELRDLAHGILPLALTHGGLRAGIDALVDRVDLPVAIDVPAQRLPAELEASAYFIVAEALTNVIKHAQATRAEVAASLDQGVLQLEISDDGTGCAGPPAHGLVGMADRVNALSGTLSVQSPAGGGTVVSATLPLHADVARAPSGRGGCSRRVRLSQFLPHSIAERC